VKSEHSLMPEYRKGRDDVEASATITWIKCGHTKQRQFCIRI